MNNERFLITGALGCIGAWVVRNLVREGLSPVIFDLGGEPRRLRQIMIDDELAQITFIEGDITDLVALERALDSHDITRVIHLAALQVPFCRANPPLGAQVNMVGTVNVFEAVARRKQQIDKVVYASSVAVFDAADIDERGRATIDPSGKPATLYGVYKLANEGTAHVYWQDHGVASIGLRPYTVYGVGRDQGMTSAPTKAMFAAAVGQPYAIPFGGRGTYDYTNDVARTFIAAARAPHAGAAVVNTAGTVAHMDEIIAAIEDAAPEARGQISYSGGSLPFPEELDTDALSAIVGTVPRTPLRDAVAETVSGFRRLVEAGTLAPDALLH